MQTELSVYLTKAHEIIMEIIDSSRGVADENSLGMFHVIENVIKRISDSVNDEGVIDSDLYKEFDKVKGISVRVFEGTTLDDLIWKINSKLRSR